MYAEYSQKSFLGRISSNRDYLENQYDRSQDTSYLHYPSKYLQNAYINSPFGGNQDVSNFRQSPCILNSAQLAMKRAQSTNRLLLSPVERTASAETTPASRFTDMNMRQLEVIQEPVRNFLTRLKGNRPNPQYRPAPKQSIQFEPLSNYQSIELDAEKLAFQTYYDRQYNSRKPSPCLSHSGKSLPSYLKPNPFRITRQEKNLQCTQINEAANELYEEVKEDIALFRKASASYSCVEPSVNLEIASKKETLTSCVASVQRLNVKAPSRPASQKSLTYIFNTSSTSLKSSLFKEPQMEDFEGKEDSGILVDEVNQQDLDDEHVTDGLEPSDANIKDCIDDEDDECTHQSDGDEDGYQPDDNSDVEADVDNDRPDEKYDDASENEELQYVPAVKSDMNNTCSGAPTPERRDPVIREAEKDRNITRLIENKDSLETRPPSSVTLNSSPRYQNRPPTVKQLQEEKDPAYPKENETPRRHTVSSARRAPVAPDLAGDNEMAAQKARVARKVKKSKLEQAPPRAHPALISSLFPNVPPCIRFIDENEKIESLPHEFRKLLHWRASLLTPMVVKNVLSRSSFKCSKLTNITEDLETVESSDWIYYFGKHMRPAVFSSIHDYQKVNHLPCSFQLGRKDRLWRNLSAMQAKFGLEDFDFVPETFCMPTDFDKFKDAWDASDADQQWILKPPAAARGIGIRVVKKWSQISKKRPLIVQRYLSSPFLINHSKFDLRIYVFVYSLNPLCVFVHEDGLTRFASHRYSNSPRLVGNRFVHLTNYSINRLNSDYVSNSNDLVCKGHKWSLRALWKYFKEIDIDPVPIWNSIKDVILKTCISIESALKVAVSTYCNSSRSAQEVFGFDIFLDENLKPWLLEVNVSPSMHSDSQLDVKVKGNMIKDMLNLTGIQLPEPKDVSNASVKTLNFAPPRSTVDPHPTVSATITTDVLELKTADGTDNPTVIRATASPKPAKLNAPATRDSSGSMRPCGDVLSSTAHHEKTTKPSKPVHPWLMDRRLDIKQLSPDERAKQEFYIMRAYEAGFPFPSGNTRPRKTGSFVKMATHKPNISMGIGPDSENLEGLIQRREKQQQLMLEKQMKKRMLTKSIKPQSETSEGPASAPKSATPPPAPSPRKPPSQSAPDNVIHFQESCAVKRFRWATENILDTLTPYDVRCLIHVIDLLQRAGEFQCIFPIEDIDKASMYLGFFERPRYASLLVTAFFDKYGLSDAGISLLTKLCEKGVHLKSGFFDDPLDYSNVWHRKSPKKLLEFDGEWKRKPVEPQNAMTT